VTSEVLPGADATFREAATKAGDRGEVLPRHEGHLGMLDPHTPSRHQIEDRTAHAPGVR
jgi:hypothetical protein